jgi:hypothetical protein
MFTFTLTADSVEGLRALILAAAEKILADEPAPEKTIADFPLAEIVAHLNDQGFKVS